MRNWIYYRGVWKIHTSRCLSRLFIIELFLCIGAEIILSFFSSTFTLVIAIKNKKKAVDGCNFISVIQTLLCAPDKQKPHSDTKTSSAALHSRVTHSIGALSKQNNTKWHLIWCRRDSMAEFMLKGSSYIRVRIRHHQILFLFLYENIQKLNNYKSSSDNEQYKI